ncbi:MAG: hypothetical protein M1819_005667 [Sarea resinae]|nr:MAG: hypothetical protein M1819_005667 [Sarea resinae]
MDGTRERTETMSSNKSYSRPPSAASHAGRFQPPSAEVPEMPVLSSEPIPPRNGLDRDGRPLPNGPAPPRPARPDDSPDLGAFVELEKHGIDPATPIQDIPPNFPLPNSVLGAGPGPTGPLPRRPSEPSAAPRPRRPTITSGGAATDDGAGENGYVAYQPSGSVSAQTKPPPRTSSRNGERADSRLGDAPPVPNPIPTVSEDYSVGNPYHTPTESVSSNGSGYGSDAKTGSSRSSPPLSDASGNLRGKQSDPVNIDNAINDFRPPRTGSPWGDASGANSRPPPIRTGSPWSDAGSVNSRGPPPSFSRPMRPMEPPESPMDPAYQRRPFPAHPPSGHPAVPPPLRRPDAPAPQHRPNTSGKGKCRGCGELIKGKSVSSADGRLTGRYHKQCFVCQTCKEPFQTADFYVINNHPYCERHYHKLNGSLCESCDRGIEGEYLETQQKRKFHPHCLTCSTCNKSLSDDYFEMNGKVYCERDAARAAQQTAFLGPERKNPERRTTRLMMM